MVCLEIADDPSELNKALENKTLVLLLLAPELGPAGRRVFETACAMKLEAWQSVFLVTKRSVLSTDRSVGWFGPLPVEPVPPETPKALEAFAVRRNAQSVVQRRPISELLRKGVPSRLLIQHAMSLVPPQG